jgi:hypothetical protein
MQVSMQSLDQNSMQINTAKYSGHGWGNAPVQPDPQHPTLGPVEVPWQRCRLYPGRAYKKPPRYSGKVTFVECGKSLGPTPGQKRHLHPTDLTYSTVVYCFKLSAFWVLMLRLVIYLILEGT